MAAVLAALSRFGVPAAALLRDPAAQVGYWPFIGFMSHLGVFAMGAAGVICLFAASCGIRNRGPFVAFGIYSFLIAADDFFMLHEHFWPNRGVSEIAVLTVYGLIGLAIATRFARDLLDSRNAAFWLAVALLGASALLDQTLDHTTDTLIAEDMLKFAGLWVWAAYWFARARAGLRCV